MSSCDVGKALLTTHKRKTVALTHLRFPPLVPHHGGLNKASHTYLIDGTQDERQERGRTCSEVGRFHLVFLKVRWNQSAKSLITTHTLHFLLLF